MKSLNRTMVHGLEKDYRLRQDWYSGSVTHAAGPSSGSGDALANPAPATQPPLNSSGVTAYEIFGDMLEQGEATELPSVITLVQSTDSIHADDWRHLFDKETDQELKQTTDRSCRTLISSSVTGELGIGFQNRALEVFQTLL